MLTKVIRIPKLIVFQHYLKFWNILHFSRLPKSQANVFWMYVNFLLFYFDVTALRACSIFQCVVGFFFIWKNYCEIQTLSFWYTDSFVTMDFDFKVTFKDPLTGTLYNSKLDSFSLYITIKILKPLNLTYDTLV